MLLAGGLITSTLLKHDGTTPAAEAAGVGRWLGSLLILLWFVILTGSIATCQSSSYGSHKVFHWWETFYRIGSFMFGATWGPGGVKLAIPITWHKTMTLLFCV